MDYKKIEKWERFKINARYYKNKILGRENVDFVINFDHVAEIEKKHEGEKCAARYCLHAFKYSGDENWYKHDAVKDEILKADREMKEEIERLFGEYLDKI